MTDGQDHQGALLCRELQQALKTFVVERPDDRASQSERDRLQQKILSRVTDLHVHVSSAAASVLRRCSGFDGTYNHDRGCVGDPALIQRGFGEALTQVASNFCR